MNKQEIKNMNEKRPYQDVNYSTLKTAKMSKGVYVSIYIYALVFLVVALLIKYWR